VSEVPHHRVTSVNLTILTSIEPISPRFRKSVIMAEREQRLAVCDRQIADLTLRIASLKESSEGSGLIAADEFIRLFEQTLESWRQAKRALENNASSSGLN
jgi:hypothetical protein